jgi:hypothetical protein
MRRSLSILGGAAFAVAFSQFPEYAQQYTQRLGGAVDELKVITEDFDREAQAGGLTRQTALQHFEQSPDAFLVGRGVSMERTFVRYEDLNAALERLRGAGPVERLQLLPELLDTDVGARTLDNFQPAVPVTPEGFIWAGAGLLLGYVLVNACCTLIMLPFRRRRVVYR